MKNLTDIVSDISNLYVQNHILLNEFDYIKNEFISKPNPTYLFRGENDFYPETKSNLDRVKGFDKVDYETLYSYLLDLSEFLARKYFNIYDPTDPRYKPTIIELGGFLLHYGFPLHWLDLTQNLNIAAFFAVYKNKSARGRIGIVETSSLTENGIQIFKLTNSMARRPNIQEAYAIKIFDDVNDFKNSAHYSVNWYEFVVTQNDSLKFNTTNLLSTKGDIICNAIVSYIKINPSKNQKIQAMLNDIQYNLIALAE